MCFWMVSGFIYYPSLVGVLSWVAAVYICMLFNIPNTPEILGMIGALAAAFCFVMYILSSAMGGYFQNAISAGVSPDRGRNLYRK